MPNAGLDEAQVGIKIAGRNINNIRYADDTTLMAESIEELKSLLMKVKEESEKVGLKLNQSILKEISPEYSCWSWNSDTLISWCEELTHWKRPWWWERLKARGEGDDRGWDGWMASLTRCIWVQASSGRWWWTGRSGVLQSMGSQKVRHDGETELNWSGKHTSSELVQCIALKLVIWRASLVAQR